MKRAIADILVSCLLHTVEMLRDYSFVSKGKFWKSIWSGITNWLIVKGAGWEGRLGDANLHLTLSVHLGDLRAVKDVERNILTNLEVNPLLVDPGMGI